MPGANIRWKIKKCSASATILLLHLLQFNVQCKCPWLNGQFCRRVLFGKPFLDQENGFKQHWPGHLHSLHTLIDFLNFLLPPILNFYTFLGLNSRSYIFVFSAAKYPWAIQAKRRKQKCFWYFAKSMAEAIFSAAKFLETKLAQARGALLI